MIETIKHISYKGKDYPLAFNFNVLEKIQDKYGKIYFINGPVITRGNDDVVTCYFERID